MIPSINLSNGHENDKDDLVWLEVKCSDSNKPGDTDNNYEVLNVMEESTKNSDWLPDKVDRTGNWYLFDTHFDNKLSVDPNQSENTVQILCCNLTQTADSSAPALLFHIDYWRKQIAGKIK